MLLIKKLKNKAYENDKIISNKVDIILNIFKSKTDDSIKNHNAKAMIVTSSRKAAAKYKRIMDTEIKKRNLSYKTLVAFTGSVKLDENEYTENSLNGRLEKKTIEKEFKKKEYRFLIVANKFQTGFNEPLLHTMFLDKSLSGINAVQTISRLNRIYPNKMNTLVVDFTNSYKEIIKAFRQFKNGVEDFNDIDITDLPNLQKEIFNYNIFAIKDIEDFQKAFIEASQTTIDNIFTKIESSYHKKYNELERRKIRNQLNKFLKLFNYLDNLVKIDDLTTRNLSRFIYYLSKYLNPLGLGKKIDEELKKVFLTRYKVTEAKENSLKETLVKLSKFVKKEVSYATIDEVVEAINLHFKLALTEGEEDAIKNYIEAVSRDPEIIRDIRANIDKDLDRLFEISMKEKLYMKFMDYFMHYNIDKVSYYIERGLEAFVNKALFGMIVENIKNGESKRNDSIKGLEFEL